MKQNNRNQASLFPETMNYLEAQTDKQKFDKKCFEEHQTKMNLLFEITGKTFRERRIESMNDELILKLHYLKEKYKKKEVKYAMDNGVYKRRY